MQGHAQVIVHLNQVLLNELTAINQYFLHARMLKHWGVEKFGKHDYDESIRAMKDADKLIERILFLEGIPNLQQLGKLYIGETVQEILECDLKMDKKAHPDLVAAIAYCEQVQDYVSRDLLTHLLEDAEEQLDWIGTQLDLVEKVGIQNYIQSQM